MADLTVTAAQVALADPQKAETVEMLAAVALTAGQWVYQDANGKAALTDASVAGTAQVRGMALQTVGAGQAVTVVKRGEVVGFTLTSLAYDARVFLSDTAGALADAAGTVSVTVGRVLGLTDKNITKVLYIDTDWRTQHA